MLTISIEPTTQNKLEQVAQVIDQSVDEIVNQAVERYLDYLGEQQLAAEIEAFEQMHAQLKMCYLGQYVAIHKGALVDTDANCEALFLRIQKQYGPLTILIRQVGETPDEIYYFHGTRLEKD